MVDFTQYQFLPFANLAAAQQRARSMANAMHCDGVFTVYWHMQVALTDGTACVVIEPSGAYSTKPGSTALQQLTPSEIAALVPWSTVRPVWPQPTAI